MDICHLFYVDLDRYI